MSACKMNAGVGSVLLHKVFAAFANCTYCSFVSDPIVKFSRGLIGNQREKSNLARYTKSCFEYGKKYKSSIRIPDSGQSNIFF